MDISIPLNKMTINGKLRVIEEIWEDLLRDFETANLISQTVMKPSPE